MFLVIPSIDLSLIRILAGHFISLTLLPDRLSIFGSMMVIEDNLFEVSSLCFFRMSWLDSNYRNEGKICNKKAPTDQGGDQWRRVQSGQGEWSENPTRRKPYPRGVERFNPAPPICLEYLVEVFAEKYDAWKNKAYCDTYYKCKYIARNEHSEPPVFYLVGSAKSMLIYFGRWAEWRGG